MSRDNIRVDYTVIDNVARELRQSAEILETLRAELMSIAQMIDDGALKGRSNEVFTEILRARAVPSVGRLGDKFQELSGDLKVVISFMNEADATSKRAFQ